MAKARSAIGCNFQLLTPAENRIFFDSVVGNRLLETVPHLNTFSKFGGHFSP